MIASIASHTWFILVESAPYILFGTLFAGVLRSILNTARLPAWLAAPNLGAVIRSSLIGVPLPLCSCSVLPVAAELRRSGASRGATASFLVSTPQTGADSALLTVGLINPFFAVARIVAAFITGFLTGAVLNADDRRVHRAGTQEAPAAPAVSSCCSGGCGAGEARKKLPWKNRLIDGQRYAFTDLLPALAGYYVIGIAATGVAMAMIPDGFLERFVGGGILGMLMVCVVGVVVYICAAAATPMAAALMARGMSPGTALVLLMAGPATSLASLAAVRAMLGTRGLALYLASIIGCAIVLGLTIDALLLVYTIPLAATSIEGTHEHTALVWHLLAAILTVMLVYWTVRPVWKRGFALLFSHRRQKVRSEPSCCEGSSG